MTKEKILKIILIICLIASIYLIYNTYSRYTEEVEAKYGIDVSQWLIKIQEEDIYGSTTWVSKVTPQYVQNDDIADGVIVPGGIAYLEFTVDYSVVNVAFEMEGTLECINESTTESGSEGGTEGEIVAAAEGEEEIGTGSGPTGEGESEGEVGSGSEGEGGTEGEGETEDEITNEFKDFKLLGYTTVTSTGESSLVDITEDKKIKKQYNLTETTDKVDKIRIYFTWYDGDDNKMSDAADTAYRGEEISGEEYTNLKYKLTLNFNQINPSPESESNSGENTNTVESSVAGASETVEEGG